MGGWSPVCIVALFVLFSGSGMVPVNNTTGVNVMRKEILKLVEGWIWGLIENRIDTNKMHGDGDIVDYTPEDFHGVVSDVRKMWLENDRDDLMNFVLELLPHEVVTKHVTWIGPKHSKRWEHICEEVAYLIEAALKHLSELPKIHEKWMTVGPTGRKISATEVKKETIPSNKAVELLWSYDPDEEGGGLENKDRNVDTVKWAEEFYGRWIGLSPKVCLSWSERWCHAEVVSVDVQPFGAHSEKRTYPEPGWGERFDFWDCDNLIEVFFAVRVPEVMDKWLLNAHYEPYSSDEQGNLWLVNAAMILEDYTEDSDDCQKRWEADAAGIERGTEVYWGLAPGVVSGNKGGEQ